MVQRSTKITAITLQDAAVNEGQDSGPQLTVIFRNASLITKARPLRSTNCKV